MAQDSHHAELLAAALLADDVRAAGDTCFLQFTNDGNSYVCAIVLGVAAPFGPAELMAHPVYLTPAIRVAHRSLFAATQAAVVRWRAGELARAFEAERGVRPAGPRR